MPSKFKLMKTKWYPQIHQQDISWRFTAESSVADYTTIVPIVHQDEGLGAPSAIETNPQNASFTEIDYAGCFPESRVDNVFAQMTLTLTKGFLETDKGHALTMFYMPIFLSFDDALATDELSTNDIGDVLEMTRENTDRQSYPLWNDVKLREKHSNSALMDSAQPGLTSGQKLEGIAMSQNTFYDALNYYTISNKLKTVVGGMKQITLTRQHPSRKIKIHFRPKSKFMNPYTFFGMMVGVHPAGGQYQIPNVGELTVDTDHVDVMFRYRYNEWNQEFNFGKV